MNRRILQCVSMLVIGCMCMVFTIGTAGAEVDLISMARNVRAYSYENLELMAEDFPNGVIEYRGSDTMHSLNNTIVCCGLRERVIGLNERVIGIGSFIQVNNVFPLHWSDVFYIGMRADDLDGILCDDSMRADNIEIVRAVDGDVERITCTVKKSDAFPEDFQLAFSVYAQQVYQIEFSFLTSEAED